MRAAGLSCPAAMDRYAISGRDVGEDYLKAAAPKGGVPAEECFFVGR
jgi:hypothetical protein